MTKNSKNEEKLSETDLKIIHLLQRDGRIPISEIHKETGIAESTIIYHIKKLHSKGVIQGYVPILDFRKLGWKVFATLGIDVEADKIPEVCKKLIEINQISDVLESSGRHDILVRIYSKDLESLSDFLNEKIRKIPGIKKVNIIPITKIHKLW
ncbi:MAG: Lrp/AsnC family transcriptional regulator [Candidatus Helarchaeota archaeon]